MAEKYEIITTPKESKSYKISLWDSIEDFADYDKLFETMNKISEKDEVELSVLSPGGRCDIGFIVYDRIKSLPCKVDVKVPYPTYSMGAVLSLSGDSLKIAPGAFLMFHDYGTGARGKGNEIFKQSEAYKKTFEYRFNSACQPFLTKKECESILHGKDLYVHWDDSNLETRIKRHFK